jgi:hypothetical protein
LVLHNFKELLSIFFLFKLKKRFIRLYKYRIKKILYFVLEMRINKHMWKTYKFKHIFLVSYNFFLFHFRNFVCSNKKKLNVNLKDFKFKFKWQDPLSFFFSEIIFDKVNKIKNRIVCFITQL